MKNLRTDLFVIRNKAPKVLFLSVLLQMIMDAGFRAVFLYRVGHYCRRHKMRIIAIICEKMMHHLCHCWISTNANIGPGLAIRHVGCIIIGSLVEIGANCDIRQGITLGGNMGKTGEDGRSQPVLGDNVLIGAGAKILGPVKVGSNSVIGANAVVISSFGDNSVIGGVPAKLIKTRG